MDSHHGSRKPPNARFTPLKFAFRNRRSLNLSYRDLYVFWHLWDMANYKTNLLKKISQDKLAARLDLKRSHLNESLLNLECAGCISRKPGHIGKTTEYLIHAPQKSVTENGTPLSPF